MIRHKVLTYLAADKDDIKKCGNKCPFISDDDILEYNYWCNLFGKYIPYYRRCDECKKIDLQSISIYDKTGEIDVLIKPILKNILISYYIASNPDMIAKYRGISSYTFSVYDNVMKLALFLGIDMEEVKKDAEEALK